MKTKKEVKKSDKVKKPKKPSYPIYKCEVCGYENIKTFMHIFEDKEYRYCPKCVTAFYEGNFPKAILKK